MNEKEIAANDCGYVSGYEAGRRSNHAIIEGLSNTLAIALVQVKKRPHIHEIAAKWMRLAHTETKR